MLASQQLRTTGVIIYKMELTLFLSLILSEREKKCNAIQYPLCVVAAKVRTDSGHSSASAGHLTRPSTEIQGTV